MLTIQKSALTIDDAGLHYGSLKLAKFRDGVLSARPVACRRLAWPEQAAAVEKAIAAWNRGDKISALLRLVHLGAPELGSAPISKGWLRHCELVRLAKAGFDPNQPRDDHGMWTDEDSSSDDVGADESGQDVSAETPTDNADSTDGASDISSTPTSSTASADVSTTGTIDDGVYYTTIGADGKPVLPTATLAHMTPEEELIGPAIEEGEQQEMGASDLFPQVTRLSNAFNTMRQLDSNNQALENTYSVEDISSRAAADDMETAAGEASLKRVLQRFMPNGERLGQAGSTGIREVSVEQNRRKKILTMLQSVLPILLPLAIEENSWHFQEILVPLACVTNLRIRARQSISMFLGCFSKGRTIMNEHGDPETIGELIDGLAEGAQKDYFPLADIAWCLRNYLHVESDADVQEKSLYVARALIRRDICPGYFLENMGFNFWPGTEAGLIAHIQEIWPAKGLPTIQNQLCWFALKSHFDADGNNLMIDRSKVRPTLKF